MIIENMWVKCVDGGPFRLKYGNFYWVEKVDEYVWLNENDVWDKSRFTPATYSEAQQASGLKAGDRVKILRAAKSGEKDWQNTWSSHYMDKLVGEEGIFININSFSPELGCEVKISDSYWRFPFFVLEKVNTETKQKDKIMQEPVKYLVKNEFEAEALRAVMKSNKDITKKNTTIFNYASNYNCFVFRPNNHDMGFVGTTSVISDEINKIISLGDMINLISEFKRKVKPFPAAIKVGDYRTEWILDKDDKFIDKVKVGCQTIDVKTIAAVAAAIEEYNKE